MNDIPIDDDDQVVELDSWFAGNCGACGCDELDAHEYSDGAIEYVCAHCGAHNIEVPDDTPQPEVQP
jgi:hypothetical protein